MSFVQQKSLYCRALRREIITSLLKSPRRQRLLDRLLRGKIRRARFDKYQFVVDPQSVLFGSNDKLKFVGHLLRRKIHEKSCQVHASSFSANSILVRRGRRKANDD
jgi:hypothetical protein